MNPILFIYLIICLITFLTIFKFCKECTNILEEQNYELDKDKVSKDDTMPLPLWLILIGLSSIPIFNMVIVSFLILYHDDIMDTVINTMNHYRK